MADARTQDVEPPVSRRAPHADSPHEDEGFDLVIEPSRGLRLPAAEELWHYRELLLFLTWRDIKVRYKQTALGAAWAILQPLFTMVLFTFVFSHVAKLKTDGIPYPVFSLVALVPWYFFSGAVQVSSNSLIVNPALVTKVYFPRIYLVLSPILASLVDLALAALVLIPVMAYYGIGPGIEGLAVIPLLLLSIVVTVGVSAWLAALNVRYRDVRFIVPFLVQIWMFATPVLYTTSSLKQPWEGVYGLNPMAGVVVGIRWALVGGVAPSALMIGLSVLSGLVLLVLGVLYFGKTEKFFADVI